MTKLSEAVSFSITRDWKMNLVRRMAKLPEVERLLFLLNVDRLKRGLVATDGSLTGQLVICDVCQGEYYRNQTRCGCELNS
jgi:hypothetical protein